MSIIAEFVIRAPIFSKVLQSTPEMRMRNPAIYPEEQGTAKAMVWVWGDDFDRFERALESQTLIEEYCYLAEVDGQRLYVISHTDGAESELSYPLIFENNILVLDARGDKDGIKMRTRCPTKSALINYREGCEDKGIPFKLQKIYQSKRQLVSEGKNTLTDVQQATFLTALELGYFENPREVKMADIADELNVTTQAVSTRLRRAQKQLARDIRD